jgi:hypothetical protein
MTTGSAILTVILAIGALVPVVWSIVGLASGNVRYGWCVAGAAWAALWLLVFFISMAAKWGGCGADGETAVVWCGDGTCKPIEWEPACRSLRPQRPPACAGTSTLCATGAPVYAYCEAFQSGLVRQPWATWSDLGFMCAGLWVLWWLGFRSPRPETNPMLSEGVPLLAVTYGALLIFMGPASMLLHASMKSWAGWFDSFSVYTWMFFNGSYAFMSAWGMREGDARAARIGLVLGIWAALAGGFGAVAGFWANWRFYAIVTSGVVWGGSELFAGLFGYYVNSTTRSWWWLIGALAALAVAMTLWTLWNPDASGASFCRSVQEFPGHAIFHMLAAGAAVLTFFSFESERPRG